MKKVLKKIIIFPLKVIAYPMSMILTYLWVRKERRDGK